MTEVITPSGPYRLRASAEFGFGQRHAQDFDGVLRMAFALDGTYAPVAVAVRQAADDGPVEVDVLGSADTERVVAQTARVLSLDDQVEVPAGHYRNALLTKEWTPLEPDGLEYKLYARGVGQVLALTVSGGWEREQLISFHRG